MHKHRSRSISSTPLHGMTLIELLVVLAIVTLLLGLAAYGITAARRSMQRRAAQADLQTLRSAIERYHQTYGVWPARRLPDERGPLRNAEVVRLLRNWHIDKSLSDPQGRNRAFQRDAMLDRIPQHALDASENWLDPWRQPYAMEILPDDVWAAFQQAAARTEPDAQPLESADPLTAAAYGTTYGNARYWVKIVRSQVNVYSLGPDRITDWGYCFGDNSGYTKGTWGYYDRGDAENTPVRARGDDVRP